MSLILKQFLIIVLNLAIGFVIGVLILLVLDEIWKEGQAKWVVMAIINHTFI